MKNASGSPDSDISLSTSLSGLIEKQLEFQTGDRTLVVNIPKSWKLSEGLLKLSRNRPGRLIKIFSSQHILNQEQLETEDNIEITYDWSLATQ